MPFVRTFPPYTLASSSFVTLVNAVHSFRERQLTSFTAAIAAVNDVYWRRGKCEQRLPLSQMTWTRGLPGDAEAAVPAVSCTR
jgi:hypothetical protein